LAKFKRANNKKSMNSDFSFLATYARLTFDFNFLSKKSIGLFESRRAEIRHQRSAISGSALTCAEPPGPRPLLPSAAQNQKPSWRCLLRQEKDGKARTVHLSIESFFKRGRK
jgi:hypothetical protein